ncbi:MAG: 16S rRNA (cytidine(1402)-2'-O)-methyltransferase [Flavobacteriales bacterium]
MPRLCLVPTPIGNLEDISQRALRMLGECDFILAEDTRTTRHLLAHFSISKPLHSYHLNNEHKVVNGLAARIAEASMVCLVTDAGTPAISDPGYMLVRACLQAGVEVECLPGATAFVPALVVSGLPCEKFVFEGFLPHKKGRETIARRIAASEMTTVLYESPHRLLKTLELLATHCGPERQCSVSRELSKKFEETKRGPLAVVLAHFRASEPRGEFVVVVAGATFNASPAASDLAD